MASRIESSAINGTIQASEAVHEAMKQSGLLARFKWKRRRVSLKGIGGAYAYTLQAKLSVVLLFGWLASCCASQSHC